MRRFIYYDKDGIESYLAQITSGSIVKTSQEISNENDVSFNQEKERNLHSNLGAKIIGIGAEIQEDVKEKHGVEISTNSLVKSLEEKVLSDYAFDKVYKYFEDNKMLKNVDFKIGDVVNLEENVTVFDFDYFEKLFSQNGAYAFSIKQEKNNLNQIKRSLDNTQRQNPKIKEMIKEKEQAIKNQEEQQKSTLEILHMAKDTLPYVRFIMTKDCLIVLNDECFRDNANNVAFKYGGTIGIVGYVTNIINSDTESNTTNVFSDMYKAVNQLLISLYTGTTKVFVIHPLAMFY